MVNYELGKIYKIVDNTNGNIYIGSTTEPTLSRRLAKHKTNYTEYLNKKRNYITSFKIIENDDYDIVLLEDYPCESKDQLHKRERFYIDNNICVNKVIPTRTKQEYDKLYNEINNDIIRKKHQAYREANKEKLYAKNICDCGGSYCSNSKSSHIKTLKHQNYLKSLIG